ncbi:phage distal tail protein domain-containing protein [Listeria fleischmannii]|uniref:Uncharacterized protein n=1 Tax=Listeria fleischmannii FSL S10-1203 TaxID=1265822 RepID=W7DT42_9LIST|nr:hypothetical protein [Listeria fleischmannii]EUJ56621.1 hypothetical protein MCOL2_08846 [Listeria fleischmannii FSL S10-1203]
MTFRTLKYENSGGKQVDLTIPASHFLYELKNAGFSYTNEISQSNYTDRLEVDSTSLNHQNISGVLEIHSSVNDNASIYTQQEEIATILNYDQLVRKATNSEVSGKLIYKNATGVEVYCPVLVSDFNFGEIEEMDEVLRVLSVDISFSRLSKTWLATTPQTVKFSLEGTDESHMHPYKHPWTHGEVYIAGTGSIKNIGGNDLAKLIVNVQGEVSAFTLEIKNTAGTFIKRIKYDGLVFSGETLTIDNFSLSVKKNNVNAIKDFDLFVGDVPFFDLMPNDQYTIKVNSENLRGEIELLIYESWVSVP